MHDATKMMPTSKDSLQVRTMKKALEALEWSWGGEPLPTMEWEAMQDLRKAIEQAENQEPIGEIVQAFGDLTAVSIPVMPPVGTKLYTSPPQREWAGLTYEEIRGIYRPVDMNDYEFARAIEAKLKEKNHVD